ncbi:Succinate dehydrogenase subunit [Thalictrum thalictroides]|uniref:Succinate dehydrogenase subunit n=1 Tax=Thalictrum thalictroides TaxID=46969 RepID=A0A7J6XEI4_THATH|nr:Succinate dehydrogenase subunit [Thalictrum thalictroides]
MKSNPITNNTASQGISGVLNDAKELNNPRMIHSMAGLGLGKGESGKVAAASAVATVGIVATRRYSTSNLRPLSPHLPVYKPQSSSMSSIFHRISFMYLAGVISFYYLLYVKMGGICLTYDSFNSALYYTSKVNPMLLQMSVLSVIYQIFHWVQHLDFLPVSLGGIGNRLTKLMKLK